MILHKWLAFYSTFLNIHLSGVLTAHTTMHYVTSCKATYVRYMHLYLYKSRLYKSSQNSALLAEWPGSFTCFCGNTGVEAWNGYQNTSQHRKLTLEKNILPLLLQGFKPATFQSWVTTLTTELSPLPCYTTYRQTDGQPGTNWKRQSKQIKQTSI